MTDQPPHPYIPAGPLNDPPFMGFAPDEVRAEAFAAVLSGVPLGTFDRQMITHTIQADDDNGLRWLTSLLWRCRLAGRAEGLPGGTQEHPFLGDPGPDDLGGCQQCGYTIRAQYNPGYRFIHPEGAKTARKGDPDGTA